MHQVYGKSKDDFSEDIRHKIYRQRLENNVELEIVYNECLVMIENLVLSLGGSNLIEYGLPQPNTSEANLKNREYLRETNYDVVALRETMMNGEASLINRRTT
uniref:Uncharacterized protein n=1 Tax=Clastoptera arizonana TaxID=38151 RepID=A0A1B6EF32_9HEMI